MSYVAVVIIVAFIAAVVWKLKAKSSDGGGTPGGPKRSPTKPPEQQ